jgi:hypothetical protein
MVGQIDDRRRMDGEKLIGALEEAGVEIYAAFWVFRSFLQEWRLVIVTPVVESQGPRAVLRTIDSQLKKTNGQASFDLFDIEISGPQNPSVMHLVDTLNIESEITDTFHLNIQLGTLKLEGVHVYFAKVEKLFDHERLIGQTGGDEGRGGDAD